MTPYNHPKIRTDNIISKFHHHFTTSTYEFTIQKCKGRTLVEVCSRAKPKVLYGKTQTCWIQQWVGLCLTADTSIKTQLKILLVSARVMGIFIFSKLSADWLFSPKGKIITNKFHIKFSDSHLMTPCSMWLGIPHTLWYTLYNYPATPSLPEASSCWQMQWNQMKNM